MRPLGIEVLTIRRAPLAASPRDGSEFRDWANATDTEVTGCNVQPFILSEKLVIEINAEREFLKQAWRCWAPPGTDVTYTDRIVWRGEEYEVLGINGIWNHIMGPEHHRDFMIRLREG